MIVIGIDPGLTGALAVVTASGDLLEVVDMPVLHGLVDIHSLCATLTRFGPVDRVALENVSTRPGQSAQAGLRTGINWGVVYGALGAYERPVILVLPQKWTAALGLPKAGKSPVERRAAKEARRLRCKQVWPAHADLFARVKDDGRADAALIALWAYQQLTLGAVA